MPLNEIITYVPCDNCSFFHFFNSVRQRFKRYTLTQSLMSPSIFNITDAKGFIESFSCLYKDKRMILWLDTPYYVEYGCDMPNAIVYVTSDYVKNLIGNTIHVDSVLRPPYNLVAEDERFNPIRKTYLFAVVGAEPKNGEVIRKRIEYTSNILRGLGLRNKSIIVSNVGDFDFRAFTLDVRQLYRLLHESYFYLSLSKSEGFGLPLMEAMSVGTPAVYVNAYSYKEFAVGIPIDPYDVVVEHTQFGIMNNFVIRYSDIRSAIQEALECSMSNDCYDDLSQKALEKSMEFSQYDLEDKILSDLNRIMSDRKR